MKKISALLLALLMMCSFCALAQESEETILPEETALPFDLVGYFSTGVGFAQVQPMATWEEAVAAGLPLKSEADQTSRIKANDDQSPWNRLYYLEEGTVITFLDLRAETAKFQFVDDHFVSFDFCPEEKLALDQIVPKIVEIAGEPTEENTNMLGMTTIKWNLEVDGKLVGLSILVGEGDTVSAIAGAYWSELWALTGVTADLQATEDTAN